MLFGHPFQAGFWMHIEGPVLEASIEVWLRLARLGAVQCLHDFVVQDSVGGDEAIRGEAPRFAR